MMPTRVDRQFRSIGPGTILGLIWGLAAAGSGMARVVALDIDLPLDQVGPGRPFKIGDHHRARVFYDDAAVDRTTHIARVIHMQHLVGKAGWIPARIDQSAMPTTDAWLDLGAKPYRYHYRSAVVENGEAVLVDFDEKARRMSVRLQGDGAVVVAAPYTVDATPVAGLDAQSIFLRPPAYLMLDMEVAVDRVAAGEQETVGTHDKLHLVFDASQIDPATRRVPLLNMQHLLRGRYLPAHPDPIAMPMSDAWLDLGREPHGLHFKASVVHGKPILIEADERTHRLSIHPQDHPETVLVGGEYHIDPRPIGGPEAVEAATAGAASAVPTESDTGSTHP